MMDLYVLDKSYNKIAIIDDYVSLIWAKRYYDFGDCELYVEVTPEYLDSLQKGYYLMRSDDDMICRIDAGELDTNREDGDFMIVKGKDCRSILDQRIVWFQTNFNGTVENYIRKLITENIVNPPTVNRKIDNFTLGSTIGLTDTITEQVTFDPLGEKIIELCKTYKYGSRVTLDANNRFVFSLYKGVDRSYAQNINDYVVFSPEFDNIISSKYVSDGSNIKNAVLVAGEGEGVERSRYSMGNASGLDRFELFVDAKDLSSKTEEGETINYTEALRARGLEALSEYGMVESFEGEVEPNYSYQYGVDYNLGDIVQVMNEYGISANARIVEVIEAFDENGYSVIPTFQYEE